VGIDVGITNPDGKLSTFQESQASGSLNDLPLKGYDYQAPLGEFGQVHPVFSDLKILHLFLHDFGAQLAHTRHHSHGRRTRISV
jgi:beta-galactosidase